MQEKLTTDVGSRIIGCQAQMQSFKFSFGLCLGQRLYSHTGNLSKALQSKKLPAIATLRLALLTKYILMSLRSDENFKIFFDVRKADVRKASLHPQIEQPTLSRKGNRRNYSILTYVEGHLSAESHHPVTVEDYYRPLYFEAIDFILQALMSCFEQPSFKAFCIMEQVLLKRIEGEDASDEIEEMKKIFGDDVDVTSLSTELEVLKSICKKNKPSHTLEIIEVLKKCNRDNCLIIPSLLKIVKLLLVVAPTTATAERSFSMMRRVKTWLRATMKQKRFKSLAILTSHKDITDDLNLAEVANIFVSGHDK